MAGVISLRDGCRVDSITYYLIAGTRYYDTWITDIVKKTAWGND